MRKALQNSCTNIPAFDYLAGLAVHREEILRAIGRVLDSGCLILGPELKSFEIEFAQFVGVQNAVAVSSGTDALIIALRSLGIGPGDDVITIANGPVPTVAAIRAVGANPRFVDVDPVHLQMNPELVARAITPRTRCVVPVHLYGCPAPVKCILKICQDHNLRMIEDCAQAFGTRLDQSHVGSFGDVGCFSFYPTKNLGAFGDAGMCVTNSRTLSAKLREQRCYGYRDDRVAHVDGLNCRMDELHAACLRVRLKHVHESLKRRCRNAQWYLQRLADSKITLPSIPPGGTHSWHQFVIQVKDREGWTGFLKKYEVGFGIHYEHAVHIMPAYSSNSSGSQHSAVSLPITEQACKQVLSLPIFPELELDQLERVCEVIELGCRAGLS